MSWIRDSTLTWLQMLCVHAVKMGHIPKHVAFIMDGNRRFAAKNKVKKIEGHTKGFDKLAETLKWCLDLGIPEVTVYAFSIDNFKRSEEEVKELMELAQQKFKRLLEEKERLKEHGVRIQVIGNLSLLPPDLCELIHEATVMTKDHNKAYLNVAFAYTGREEMAQAVHAVARDLAEESIQTEDLSEDLMQSYLYLSSEPDLLIRTSGEVRFSDFLLWQSCYTCIYFTPVLWPEFGIWTFLRAILYYQRSYSELMNARKRQCIAKKRASNISCSLDCLIKVKPSELPITEKLEDSNVIS